MRRYDKTKVFPFEGYYGISNAIPQIRNGISNSTIRYRTQMLKEGERLDTLAAIEYGDGRLYWVIAAASDIGFATQSPPGTLIRIPNLEDVAKVLT